MILGTFWFTFFHIRTTYFCDARQCWLLIGWKLWVDKGWTFAMMDDREKGVTVCLKIWTCDVIIVWCRIYYVKRNKTKTIKHFLKCTLGAGWNRDPLPCSSTSFRLVLILILIYHGVDHCTKVLSQTVSHLRVQDALFKCLGWYISNSAHIVKFPGNAFNSRMVFSLTLPHVSSNWWQFCHSLDWSILHGYFSLWTILGKWMGILRRRWDKNPLTEIDDGKGFRVYTKRVSKVPRYNVIILCELYIHFCFIQGEKIVNKVPSSIDIYFDAIEIMLD